MLKNVHNLRRANWPPNPSPNHPPFQQTKTKKRNPLIFYQNFTRKIATWGSELYLPFNQVMTKTGVIAEFEFNYSANHRGRQSQPHRAAISTIFQIVQRDTWTLGLNIRASSIVQQNMAQHLGFDVCTLWPVLRPKGGVSACMFGLHAFMGQTHGKINWILVSQH